MKIYKFKPKRSRNALFLKVLLLVGGLQALLMILLGGMIITKVIIKEESSFEAAPPPPAEMKEVEVKRQKRDVMQKSARREAGNLVRRINIPPMTQTSQPPITISLPSGLGGDSIGSGLSLGDVSLGGVNLGNVKINLPTMTIFDTQASSDRVFIAFEVSEPIMKDNMGGLDAFNVVKDEIKSLIKSLPGTVIFNVMAFDTWHKFGMQSTAFTALVPATENNKDSFIKWIDTINPDPNKIGLQWNDPHRFKLRDEPPAYPKISYHYDSSHNHGVVGRYMVYQAALESGAGAIWILSMGWPGAGEYNISLGEDQEKRYMSQWDKNVKDFERGGGKIGTSEDWKEWDKYMAPMRAKAKKWLEDENKRRESKGIPKKVETDLDKIVREELKMKYNSSPRSKNDFRPDVPRFKKYNNQTLYSAYEPFFKKYYDSRELPRPKLNIIVLARRDAERTPKDNADVRSWARLNGGGTMRVLRAGKPVSEYEQ